MVASRRPLLHLIGFVAGRDERQVVAAIPERLKALGVDAVISGMAC